MKKHVFWGGPKDGHIENYEYAVSPRSIEIRIPRSVSLSDPDLNLSAELPRSKFYYLRESTAFEVEYVWEDLKWPLT